MMIKHVASVCFMTIALGSTAFADTSCDYPLDEKIYSSDFSWTADIRDGVVLFEKASAPATYLVKGVYTKRADGRYRLRRDYLVSWPTWQGNGELGFITEVAFKQNDEQCQIVFQSPENGEVYKAGFRAYGGGLEILWPETTDYLKLGDQSVRDLIDEPIP